VTAAVVTSTVTAPKRKVIGFWSGFPGARRSDVPTGILVTGASNPHTTVGAESGKGRDPMSCHGTAGVTAGSCGIPAVARVPKAGTRVEVRTVALDAGLAAWVASETADEASTFSESVEEKSAARSRSVR
jgi:hypothetical protein